LVAEYPLLAFLSSFCYFFALTHCVFEPCMVVARVENGGLKIEEATTTVDCKENYVNFKWSLQVNPN
jgi:hypothetical protein